MVLIEVEDYITNQELVPVGADELDKIINGKIRDAMALKIEEQLDKMAFIDMKENPETGNFDITASIILCSSSDMSTSLQIVAQRLSNYDLDEDAIEDVLSAFTETKGGF